MRMGPLVTPLSQDAPALQLTLPTATAVAQLEGDVTTQDFEEALALDGTTSTSVVIMVKHGERW